MPTLPKRKTKVKTMEKERNLDHDLLIRIDENLKNLAIEVKDLKENLSGRLSNLETKETVSPLTVADHETRIRRLEYWGAIALGVIGFLQVVAPYIANYLKSR